MSPPFPGSLSRKAAAGQAAVVASVFCAIIGLRLWRSGGNWSLSDQWLSSSTLFGLLMLLIVALFSVRDPRWRASLGLGHSPIGATLGWGLLSVVVIYGAGFVTAIVLFLMHIDLQAEAQKKFDCIFKFAAIPWAAIPVLVAFVGFWEELVFRGFLLGRVRALLSAQGAAATQRQRDIAAIVLTALLFGLGHGYQGVSGMVQTGVIGLVFGGLTLWRKSIWPAVFAHFTIDAVAFSATKLLAPFLQELFRSQSTP